MRFRRRPKTLKFFDLSTTYMYTSELFSVEVVLTRLLPDLIQEEEHQQGQLKISIKVFFLNSNISTQKIFDKKIYYRRINNPFLSLLSHSHHSPILPPCPIFILTYFPPFVPIPSFIIHVFIPSFLFPSFPSSSHHSPLVPIPFPLPCRSYTFPLVPIPPPFVPIPPSLFVIWQISLYN